MSVNVDQDVMKKKMFYFNEIDDLYSNMKKLSQAIIDFQNGKDHSQVKWLVIFSHMTLQSLFIYHLRFSSPEYFLYKGGSCYKNLKYKEEEYGKYKFSFGMDFPGAFILNDENKDIKLNRDYCCPVDFQEVARNIAAKIGQQELQKNIQKSIRKAYEQDTYLISFSEMFTKMCNNNIAEHLKIQPLNKDKFEKTIRYLINERDKYIHFMPSICLESTCAIQDRLTQVGELIKILISNEMTGREEVQELMCSFKAFK